MPDPIGIGMLGIGNIGREVFDYLRAADSGSGIVSVARRRPKTAAPSFIQRLIAPSAEHVIAGVSRHLG